jgi:hypothetical protein
MVLKPNENLMLAAAVGAVVYGTYNIALPTLADTRGLPGNTPDIDKAEKAATWASVAVVSGISLLAKSPEVFVVGGLMTIGLAWSFKNASTVDNFQSQARALITPDKDNTPSGIPTSSKMSTVGLTVASSGSAF